MRLALIISSNYSENNVVPSREAFEDTGALVEARLSRNDTAFTVVALKANRDLPEQLDELFEKHRDNLEGLLLHFSGYLAVKPDRGPALLLDGARLRAFPVSRLRAALSKAALHVLTMMDVVTIADSAVNLDEIANNLGIALSQATAHVSVLSSVALPENVDLKSRGCLRLTDLWLLALEYHAKHARGSLVFCDPIVQGFRSETFAFASLPSFNYQPSDQDFVIIPGHHSETGRGSRVAPTVISRNRDMNPQDARVDSRPAAPAAGDDIVEEEELPTIPPTFGKRPSILDIPIPVPPPLGTSQKTVLGQHFVGADLNDIPTLERLIESSDQTGEPVKRIRWREMLAALLEVVPDQKSLVLVEAANIALHELNDAVKAETLIERAIEADPQSPDAFNLGVKILSRQGKLQEIVGRCHRILSESLEPKLRYQASCRLLDLIEIHGSTIAIEASILDSLRDAASDDEELKLRVASTLKDHNIYEEAVALLEDALANDPRHLPSLRALSDAAQRQHDPDTAALASAVLVCLKSGRPEDDVRLAKLATDGLPLAQRTLNDHDFDQTLLAKLADVSLLRTLGQITQAAIAAGLASNAGTEELPKDATVLDPESSTVTLARSLAWAAKFVGVDTPELVVLPELPTHMELTINGKSRLLISKQLGTGLSLAQLAFLGARQLSMLHRALKWRSALDSPDRLGLVMSHCVRYAREGFDFIKSVDDSERKGAKRLVSQLEAEASLVEQVTHVFGALELDRSECQSRARQVLNAADRALLRGGLLACANPAAAWQLTLQYPLRSLLSVEEQLDEIARFATSRSHLWLRRSLGLTLS